MNENNSQVFVTKDILTEFGARAKQQFTPTTKIFDSSVADIIIKTKLSGDQSYNLICNIKGVNSEQQLLNSVISIVHEQVTVVNYGTLSVYMVYYGFVNSKYVINLKINPCVAISCELYQLSNLKDPVNIALDISTYVNEDVNEFDSINVLGAGDVSFSIVDRSGVPQYYSTNKKFESIYSAKEADCFSTIKTFDVTGTDLSGRLESNLDGSYFSIPVSLVKQTNLQPNTLYRGIYVNNKGIVVDGVTTIPMASLSDIGGIKGTDVLRDEERYYVQIDPDGHGYIIIPEQDINGFVPQVDELESLTSYKVVQYVGETTSDYVRGYFYHNPNSGISAEPDIINENALIQALQNKGIELPETATNIILQLNYVDNIPTLSVILNGTRFIFTELDEGGESIAGYPLTSNVEVNVTYPTRKWQQINVQPQTDLTSILHRLAVLESFNFIICTNAENTPKGVRLYVDSETTIEGLLEPEDSVSHGIYLVKPDTIDTTSDSYYQEYVVVNNDTGTGLRWELLGSTQVSLLYASEKSNETVVPKTIGGIVQGTKAEILKGKTLSQVFDMLLFPTIQPTFTPGTISINKPKSLIAYKSDEGHNITGSITRSPSASVQINNVTTTFNAGIVTGSLTDTDSFNTNNVGTYHFTYTANWNAGTDIVTDSNGTTIKPGTYNGVTVDENGHLSQGDTSASIFIDVVYPLFDNQNGVTLASNAGRQLSLQTSKVITIDVPQSQSTQNYILLYPSTHTVEDVKMKNLSGVYETYTGNYETSTYEGTGTPEGVTYDQIVFLNHDNNVSYRITLSKNLNEA